MKRIAYLLLACLLLISLTAGCGGKSAGSSAAEQTPEAPAPATAAPAEPAPTEEPPMYPLAEHYVLTAFSPIYAPRADWAVTSWDETPGYEAVAEATNIEVDMECVATDQFASSVNIMYTSGDLPDMIRDPARTIVGTLDDMIDNELFINLEPLLQDYAPDYYAWLADNDYLVNVTTPAGNIGYFYSIDTEPALGLGGMVRQDWLDDLGLETPVTYEDFYDVLTAFKTEKGATEPIAIWTSCAFAGEGLASGYDISVQTTTGMYMGACNFGFYQVDGEVTYGFVEPGFVDWITMMNEWYEAGLISSDFVSQNENPTADTYKAKILDGSSGMIWSDRQYIDGFNADYDVNVQPISDPRLTAGQQLHFAGYKDNSANGFFAVTSDCETPEIAAQWCNYWYTEAGIMLANFGIEGVSYDRNPDGSIYYTDFILKNPDGYSLAQTSYIYVLNTGIALNHERDAAMYSEATMHCVEVWREGRDTAYHIPSFTTMNTEESDVYKVIFTDLNVYVCENVAKFIVGEKPLSEVDAFVAEIYSIGVQDCIDAWQSALDRYEAARA